METVVLYARATSPEQANRQLQSMEDSLNPRTKVVGRYSDVGFGRDSQRPALKQALECLQKGEAESLLVKSLDRLARSVQDVALLASMFRIIEIPDYGFTWHDSSRSLRFTFQTVV